MEISFHIPVYNDDPGPLLEVLTDQWIPELTKNIFIWDDGSTPGHQSHLRRVKSRFEEFGFIRWHHHPTNKGRASIRQRILDHSAPSWNISIDSDMIPDDDFIHQLRHHLDDSSIIYQGQHYYQTDPPGVDYLLHWKYGTQREIKSQDPTSFFTGIFAWHDTLAPRLHFETKIKSYGHEDTLFGLLLDRQKIQIQTIPARALHSRLMNRNEFLIRQREAVQNLIFLRNHHPDFSNRLIRFARKIEKTPFLPSLISRSELAEWCTTKLQQPDPSLFYLDLLKLHEYIKSQ